MHRFPGLVFSSSRLHGARYRRTRESNDPTEDVGLMISREGGFLVSHGGREIVLASGGAPLVSLTEVWDGVPRGDLLILRSPNPHPPPRWGGGEVCALRQIPAG